MIFVFFTLSSLSAWAGQGLAVKDIRFFSYASFTRVVFEIEQAAPYVLTRSPNGRSLILAAYDGPLTMKSALPSIRDGVVSGVEVTEEAGRKVVVIRLDATGGEVKDFVLRAPDRIVLDVTRTAPPPAPIVSMDKPVLVVLDPGHGGRDAGIVTSQGQEKAISLDLALRVRKLLQREKNFTVILTRDRDIAVSLDDRAAVANASGAKVFLSLHAASGAAGRIYILDPDDDPGSQQQRSPGRDFLGFEAGSEQQEKTWGRQQAEHARESGELGRAIVREISGNKAAEPVQALMAGLKPVDAAAVVVEIGTEQDRTRVAEAITRGIVHYAGQNR